MFLICFFSISYNMTRKNKNRQPSSIFAVIKELTRVSKWKIILYSAFCIISLLTGIIVAIKTSQESVSLEKYNLLDFGYGFWGRLFSTIFVLLICFGSSFFAWLCPLAIIILCYRAYLLGISLCWIILCNSFMGVIFSLFVILPCQLAILGVLTFLYLILCKHRKEFCYDAKKRWGLLIVAIIILIAICVVESLLFTLFSPDVILII